MKQIPEVGDIVSVIEFSFNNVHGGTEIIGSEICTYSKENFPELFEKLPIKCKITKAWYDYECGWRYWATPINKDLLKGKSNKPNTIYVSYFDIILED